MEKPRFQKIQKIQLSLRGEMLFTWAETKKKKKDQVTFTAFLLPPSTRKIGVFLMQKTIYFLAETA